MVFSYLQSKEAVTELFREISKKMHERPGGYTRILKTGTVLVTMLKCASLSWLITMKPC